MKLKEEGEKVGLKLNIQKTKIMTSGPTISWQIDRETVASFNLGGSKTTADGDCSHEIKKTLTPWKESYDQPRQHIKKQILLCQQSLSSQGYDFSNSHVWVWELNYKESWVLMYWCFWTVVLRRLLRVPWTARRSKPVHPKGDQSWVSIGRSDVEAETPILWPPDVKN